VQRWQTSVDELSAWLGDLAESPALSAEEQGAVLGALVPWRLRVATARKVREARWFPSLASTEVADLIAEYRDGCRIADLAPDVTGLPPPPSGWTAGREAAASRQDQWERYTVLAYGVAAVAGGVAAIVLAARLPALKGKGRR
jgi:hypothetical protein